MSLKIIIESDTAGTRTVHTDLESIERVEEAIDFKEKSLESKGGRPNKVNETFEEIESYANDKMYVFACKEYLQAKKKFAPATMSKLNSKLEKANIEFTSKQKEEARNLMMSEIENL